MSDILPHISIAGFLSPRTANYVTALARDGDNFDYDKWLQQVREKEAQAKELQQTAVRSVPRELNIPVASFDCREGSQERRWFNRPASIPTGMRRSHRKPLHDTASARTIRRLKNVRDAWNEFQASRARDAVYGYLEAVFATVKHYKVRRKTRKLLRHALELADLPFDEKADPFSTVIRCTSDDNADNKTISKWARALRYIAHCKVPPAQSEQFMKEAGGVNACAYRYAKSLRQSRR